MSALAIERRAPADDQELFRLYQEVFGKSLAEGSQRRWRWQYLENPETRRDGPQIWVARDGETLLGQYASMPVRLWWGEREVRASWGMDVFLRPEARGRGVGARLFTTWSDHVEVALGLGLTPSSYGLFKKLGYEDVGPVPFYRKLLDPRAIAARRVGRLLAAPAAALAGLGLRLLHPDSGPGPGRDGIELRPITGFGPDYDRLWERARASYAMCARRDAAYLQWKYVACPHRRYDIVEARRGAELAGYAVSRVEEYRALRLGWIVDAFGHADDQGARDGLLDAVLASFRAQGVARAQAFSMNAGLGESLRRRGFMPARSPMQFCVRSQVGTAGVCDQPGRWHVVFGDSDMDR